MQTDNETVGLLAIEAGIGFSEHTPRGYVAQTTLPVFRFYDYLRLDGSRRGAALSLRLGVATRRIAKAANTHGRGTSGRRFTNRGAQRWHAPHRHERP